MINDRLLTPSTHGTMAWSHIEQRIKKFLLGRLEGALARAPRRPGPADLAQIRSVLVIRQHDMYGDFLLSTPVFRALRARFPAARIGACVRETFAELLHHSPEIDELVVVPRDRYRWSLQSFIDLWRGIRRGWDVAVVLNTVSHSLTSDLLGILARPRFIIGSEAPPLAGASRNFLYDVSVPLAPGPSHQSERNMEIVRILGIEAADLRERITLTPEEKAAGIERLRRAGCARRGPVVGMHVGAGKIKNRWPAERYAALADRVSEVGGEVVLFWGPQEAALKDAFLAAASRPALLVPPGSLRELASCFASCDAIACNDTGVMHLCASVGTPFVAFFGPTPAAEWKPVGEEFTGLQGSGGSVGEISVDDAFTALRRVMVAKSLKEA